MVIIPEYVVELEAYEYVKNMRKFNLPTKTYQTSRQINEEWLEKRQAKRMRKPKILEAELVALNDRVLLPLPRYYSLRSFVLFLFLSHCFRLHKFQE